MIPRVNIKLIAALFLLASPFAARISYGQSDLSGDADRSELDSIEAELEKSKSRANTVQGANLSDDARPKQPEFSTLGQLAPFSEVSVIQKRFLPKTGRFIASLQGAVVTNNAFFNSYGGTARLGYYLTETWGLDIDYTGFTTSARDITRELEDEVNVTTTSLVFVNNVVGLNLVMVPIYGKMSWFNNSIVPFDLYFSAGYGASNTSAGSNLPTLHLRTGQVFAVTKSFALRWDFSFDVFTTKDEQEKSTANNNLYMTLGASFFFPGAKYR